MRVDFTDVAVRETSIRSLARRLARLLDGQGNDLILAPDSEIQELERAITELPASNLTEIAIQLMLASAYIERGEEELIEDRVEYLRGLNRLIRSALTALLRETGIDLSEYAGHRYAPSHTDPFQDLLRIH